MLRHLVMTVRFTEVIYGIGSDLPYMGRGILRRDQYKVSLLIGNIRNAGTGVAKPNARARFTGSVLKCRVVTFKIKGCM